MARISELVDAVADVTGVIKNNVVLHARLAREAGFISQGGRGLSAPEMTPRDAAALIAALVVSPTAKETADTLRALSVKNSELKSLETFPFYVQKRLAEVNRAAESLGFERPNPGVDDLYTPDTAFKMEKPMDIIFDDDEEVVQRVPAQLSFIQKEHSFLDALETLIAAEPAVTRLLEDVMFRGRVHISGDKRPAITITHPEFSRNSPPALSLVYGRLSDNETADLRSVRYVTWTTIQAASKALK